MKPFAWYCPVCKKFDLADAKEPMAKPEHIPYRGVDIGECKGNMIALYTVPEIDPELTKKNGVK